MTTSTYVCTYFHQNIYTYNQSKEKPKKQKEKNTTGETGAV